MRLFAISWPSAFFDPGLSSETEIKDPHEHFYSILNQQTIPKGAETKYENTIEFFDYVAAKRRSTSPADAPPHSV